MAKEILLYWGISGWTVESLIMQLEAFKKDKVTLRVNSPGGDVYAAYGLYAKIIEHGDVHVKIDGMAASAAAFLPFFAKSTECLNVSNAMFHRASMDGSDKELTAEQRQRLDKVNSELRTQIEMKVSPAKFLMVTGTSIDQLFSMEGRLNVWLTADMMDKLGIVNKVNPLTPEIEQKLASASADWATQIAASYEGLPPASTNKNDNMTLAEFKEKYPAIYSEAIEAGKKLGIEAESDRVNSVMVFSHLDLDGAKKIIASGKPMTETQRSEFALKAMSPEALKAVQAGNPPPVKTDEPPVKGAEDKKELQAFEANLRAELGLDKGEAKVIQNKNVALVQLN